MKCKQEGCTTRAQTGRLAAGMCGKHAGAEFRKYVRERGKAYREANAETFREYHRLYRKTRGYA